MGSTFGWKAQQNDITNENEQKEEQFMEAIVSTLYYNNVCMFGNHPVLTLSVQFSITLLKFKGLFIF